MLERCWIVAHWVDCDIIHGQDSINACCHKCRCVRNESTETMCNWLSAYCHWVVRELETWRIVFVQLVLLCSDCWICKCHKVCVNAGILESQNETRRSCLQSSDSDLTIHSHCVISAHWTTEREVCQLLKCEFSHTRITVK